MRISGDKIRAARVACGMRIEDVASKASVSMSSVVRLEAGTANPSALALARIASVLEVSIDDLFEVAA